MSPKINLGKWCEEGDNWEGERQVANTPFLACERPDPLDTSQWKLWTTKCNQSAGNADLTYRSAYVYAPNDSQICITKGLGNIDNWNCDNWHKFVNVNNLDPFGALDRSLLRQFMDVCKRERKAGPKPG